MSDTRQQRLYAIAAGAITWLALILQLILILKNRQAAVTETIIRYFSYFTILANILAALVYTFSGAGGNAFFKRAGVQTATAVYIVIVGLVYNTVLRFQWSPEGMDRVADELLHSVSPLLFVVYWLLFTDKQPLHWRHIPAWLLFPLCYLAYTLLRGSMVHVYPYPFIDVDRLGYAAALLNCLWVTIAFVLFSLLFVALAKAWRKRPPATS